MSLTLHTLILFSVFTIASNSWGALGQLQCDEIKIIYPATYVTQFPQDKCRLSAKDYRLGQRYLRFYNFNHEGRFDVFDVDSTIESNSRGTGVRVIYNLPRPRNSYPKLFIENDQVHFKIVLMSGEWIRISGLTHQITDSSMSIELQEKEMGALKFQKPSRGLLIDTEFHLGRESYAHPTLPGASRVTNSLGRSCSVENKLLFNKVGENYPLRMDEELRPLLKNKCNFDF